MSDGETKVEVMGLDSPQFPHRQENVVFVANLMGLFFENDSLAEKLRIEVGEVDSYGARLLPILNLIHRGPQNNLLILEREPDLALCEFLREFGGLSIPDSIVLPHASYLSLSSQSPIEQPADHIRDCIDRIQRHPASRIDGYVTDKKLLHIATQTQKKTFSTFNGSHQGNNKVALHQFLVEQELPTPPTVMAEAPTEISACLGKLREQGYRSAVIKAGLGASGIGIHQLKNFSLTGDYASTLDDGYFSSGPCLVQAWLEPGRHNVSEILSPSVQLFLTEGQVRLFDMTEQLLSSQCVHQGNESPPHYLTNGRHPGLQDELLTQAEKVATWLYQQGYRGPASVDFLVALEKNRNPHSTTGTGNNFTVYVCEINARVTGATYPSILARHFLPNECWRLQNLRFANPLSSQQLLELLSESPDIFTPGESQQGFFPINFNFGDDQLVHKIQLLSLGRTPALTDGLLRLASVALPCHPDRD